MTEGASTQFIPFPITREEYDRLRADSAMLDKLLRLGIAVELRGGMYAYFKDRAEITEVLEPLCEEQREKDRAAQRLCDEERRLGEEPDDE